MCEKLEQAEYIQYTIIANHKVIRSARNVQLMSVLSTY